MKEFTKGETAGGWFFVNDGKKPIAWVHPKYVDKFLAAPAMYEATKIALDLVETVLYEHPDDEIAKEQKKVIDKALAQAKGKTP